MLVDRPGVGTVSVPGIAVQNAAALNAIDSLPTATPLTGNEPLPVIQGGEAVQTTPDAILNVIGVLPEATLPLDGTEPTVIIQDGVAVQVPTGAIGGTAAVQYASIAALRSGGATPPPGAVAIVRGYYAGTYVGGGWFEYNAADSTTADDGGVVIVAGSARWVRQFSGPIDPKWFGAQGVALSANDTAYVQAAINYLHGVGGGELIWTDLFYVAPTTVGGVCLNTYSNISYVATSPANGIKVIANAGNYFTILYGLSNPLLNAYFGVFTVDSNAQNNTTSNVTPGDATKALVSLTCIGACDGIDIDHTRFPNSPGVNTILFNAGVGSTKNVTITEPVISFYPAASTTPNYDNSGVYIHGQDCLVSGPRFTNLGSHGAARTAIEVHGINIVVTDPIVSDYYQVGNIVSEPSPVTNLSTNVVFTSAVGRRVRAGVQLFGLTSSTLSGVDVHDNNFSLAPSLFPAEPTGSYSYGIALALDLTGAIGNIQHVKIHDNTVITEKNNTAGLVNPSSSLISLDTGATLFNVSIKGNILVNAPSMAISCFNHSSNPATNVFIDENVIVDAGNNTTMSLRYGLLWRGTQPWVNCRQRGNRYIDTATGGSLNGVYAYDQEFLGSGSSVVTENETVIVSNSAGTPLAEKNLQPGSLAFPTLNIATWPSPILTMSFGARRFIINATSTSASTILVDGSFPPPDGTEIGVTIFNTSGGTLAITWAGGFALLTAWVQPTVGQTSEIYFRYDAAAAKYRQITPQSST